MVVCKFNCDQVFIPGFIEIGKVVAERFDDGAVCMLNEALGLRVVGRAQSYLGATESEEFTPKV